MAVLEHTGTDQTSTSDDKRPIAVVASHNPIKLAAARAGFARLLPERDFDWRTVAVDSGVADQPVGNAETLLGARQRTERAAEVVPEASYWIGLEGGIEDEQVEGDQRMYAFAWIVVRSARGVGQSRTASFQLPPEIAELVRSGVELGVADDRVFRRQGTKMGQGAVGLLTDGVIDRSGLYEPAVVLALMPLLKSELFPASCLAPRPPSLSL